MGKTFAEIIAKFVVPALLSRLQFDFEDETIKNGPTMKPKMNLDMDDDPVVLMKVTKVDLTKL